MSILSLISNVVTPPVLSQIASMLGTQDSQVERAMNGAVPGLLAALLGATKNADGKGAFAKALAKQDPSMLDDLDEMLNQDGPAIAGKGGDMLAAILGGGRLGQFTAKLQHISGVSAAAAGSITGLAGALIMGALGKISKRDGLDAPGLLSKLQGEVGEIAKALPLDFAEAFRGAGFLEALDAQLAAAQVSSSGDAAAPVRRARVPTAPKPPPGRPWWQYALLGVAVVAILFWTAAQFGGEDATSGTDTGSVGLVDGTDVGAQLQSIMTGLAATMASITDAASAEAAVPNLSTVLDTLNGVAFTIADLPSDGQAALRSAVQGALPALREAADGLMDNSAIQTVVGPLLQQVMETLQNLA